MIEKYGWWFPDGDTHFDQYIQHGGYQPVTYLVGVFACQKYRTAVDIGAHVGLFSRPLTTHFNNVYSFEPIKENYECLLRNAPTAISRNVALSSTNGLLNLETVTGNSGAGFVSAKGTIQVPAITLDSLNLSEVDYVKIDIQGYELEALKGAEQTLKTWMPVICLECKGGNVDPQGSLAYLSSLGYNMGATYKNDAFLKRK